MPKKPSFFERLTGTNWSEEEGAKTAEPVKMSTNKKKKSKKDKKMTQSKTTTKKNVPEEKKETKDWLAESEGQLTIDVYQTPNEVVIKSTIAGVDKTDIDITMSNDMITIKGIRHKDEEVKEDNYYYQECYWGPFSRSIILPVDVEVDQADAALKNGILTIKLPKIEKVKTKKISIKAE